MKKLFALSALALAVVATPAAAQEFTGPRIEAQIGTETGDDLTLGGAVGYDVAVSPRTRLGLEGNANFNGTDEYGVSARLGYVAGPGFLPFVKAGYVNRDGLDGYRLGGGAELNLGRGVYTNLEYRYSDYQRGFSESQALVGLGLRF